MRDIIERLDQAASENPDSVSLRTCLGMAHAANEDVQRSMEALEEARWLDPADFWAQMKYSELLYRQRALPRAERETKRALDLATDGRQRSTALAQFQEIRGLMHVATLQPAWPKAAWPKAMMKLGAWLAAMCAAASLLAILR